MLGVRARLAAAAYIHMNPYIQMKYIYRHTRTHPRHRPLDRSLEQYGPFDRQRDYICNQGTADDNEEGITRHVLLRGREQREGGVAHPGQAQDQGVDLGPEPEGALDVVPVVCKISNPLNRRLSHYSIASYW